METQALHTGSKLSKATHEVTQNKGGFEMIYQKITSNAKASAKILGGLALGALLMTATVLTSSSTLADEPSRPLSGDTQAPSEVTWGMPGFDQFDDLTASYLTNAPSHTQAASEVMWGMPGFDQFDDLTSS